MQTFISTCLTYIFSYSEMTHNQHCPPGIDEDDLTSDDLTSVDAPSAPTEDMPPLEGDEDDTSRMEEVD